MKLTQLNIGKKTTSLPIIQGGMGVGVSLSSLSSAVANNGGIGIISAAQIGYREDDFDRNTDEANTRALVQEIRKARELSPDGILGVNLMVPIKNYDEMVKTCVDEKVDLIISGAGLPKDLPKLVMGSDTRIAPIVSSGKAAALLARLWQRRYDYLPDLVIVEGPDAGGHLGFPFEDLEREQPPRLEDLVVEVIQALDKYEKQGAKIPVIAAGGIYDGRNIKRFLDLGASGVQMGTRFVATEECDASPEFKNAYLKASKDDIQFVVSPLGMPGQAIVNPFIKKTQAQRIKPKKCWNCLTPCNPATTPYCISQALINSVKGDVDQGLIFIGKKGYKIKNIVSVKELMDELKEGIKEA